VSHSYMGLCATVVHRGLGAKPIVRTRFRSRGGASEGRALIERALALFENMDTTGWVAEARAAL